MFDQFRGLLKETNDKNWVFYFDNVWRNKING